jgi:hypothetical protein
MCGQAFKKGFGEPCRIRTCDQLIKSLALDNSSSTEAKESFVTN